MNPLKRTNPGIYHMKNGERIDGSHNDLTGNVTWLTGNCTNISGNLDLIPMDERKNKPNIADWVGED